MKICERALGKEKPVKRFIYDIKTFLWFDPHSLSPDKIEAYYIRMYRKSLRDFTALIFQDKSKSLILFIFQNIPYFL